MLNIKFQTLIIRIKKFPCAAQTPKRLEEIVFLLESVLRRTKPTAVNPYEVFFAVLYLLSTDCQ